MKKLISIVLLLSLVTSSSFLAFARSKAADDLGREIAQDYLDSSTIDESWASSQPYIAEQYAYSTDTEATAYIEYKVSCDDNPNCGWIMVNVDGDDVAIPIASTQGAANFELLNGKLNDKISKKRSGKSSKARKLYYFSPFDQYIEDESGETEALDQGGSEEITSDFLKAKRAEAKSRKSSDAFKERRKGLEADGLTSMSRSHWLGIMNTYAAANTIPNTFVAGASTTMCGSRIPCYKYNATFVYPGGACKFGCVPTAIAMIYGYHDRQGTYPNLIT